ncbi:MAG: 16S rRNA (uracil(1498)-N(3))-methyltransferase [Desulfobulbaceae bacterium]
MRRFLVDPATIVGSLATLPAGEAHHIASVLRLQTGTMVELIDGQGLVYAGRLETVSRTAVTVRLLSQQHDQEDAGRPLILLQALLKGKKMDVVVQKATELGVHTLQPLVTRYSEGRGNPARQAERWQRIMVEACKQSRRSQPMRIEPLSDFAGISLPETGPRILFWEGETTESLRPELLSPPGPVCLLLGPEGGLHQQEADEARAKGFQAVSLGRRILRAETATVAAVAIIQYLTGGLQPCLPCGR